MKDLRDDTVEDLSALKRAGVPIHDGMEITDGRYQWPEPKEPKMKAFLKKLMAIFDGSEALGVHKTGGYVEFGNGFLKASDTQFTMTLPEIPEEGSKWLHYNGKTYTVCTVTNLGNLTEKHPPDVVYYTLGEVGTRVNFWSRPLSDWHRSFTRVEET